MKISGMMKLRLAITVVFLMLITSLLIGIYVVSMETKADEMFAEKLTWDDIDDMERINAKYPETNTGGILEFSGVMIWIAIAMVSYLMYKVWNVKEIR